MSRPFSDSLEIIGGVDIKELYAVDEPLTLEEIEWLHHEVSRIVNKFEHTHSRSKPIKLKLAKMIERFCEHQPIWETPNHVICYCQVCKKVLEK